MSNWDDFFAQVAEGKSVHKICANKRFVSKSKLYRCLAEDEQLWDRYARAKEMAQHAAVNEIQDIADEATADSVHVARLRIDARKWQASKLAPKVYGDRLAIGGDKKMDPIQTEEVSAVDKLKAAIDAKSRGPTNGDAEK